MARVTTVVCDLCRSDIKPGEDCTVQLSSRAYIVSGDICIDCFETLTEQLDSPLEPVVNTKTVGSPVGPTDFSAPPEKAKGASGDPTSELLEHEMTRVPSEFDKAKAEALVRKQRGGCAHPFKSYKDGKIVCVGPPPGYDGEVASNGCGKTLGQDEY